MLPSEHILQMFRRLGYRQKKGSLSVIPLIYVIVSVLMLLNMIGYILKYRKLPENSGVKHTNVIIAVKDCILISSLVICKLECIFNKKKTRRLLGVIEKSYTNYNNELAIEQKNFIEDRSKMQNTTLQYLGLMAFIAFFAMTLTPAALSGHIIYTSGLANTKISTLPLPFTFRWPDREITIKMYAMLYLFQSLYTLQIYAFGYCIMGNLACSCQAVIVDIRLFCQELLTINTILSQREGVRSMKLRDYTNYLVKYHQNIRQTVNLVNKSVALLVSVLNQGLCIQICAFLFLTVEEETNYVKVFYFAYAFGASIVVLIYCFSGQQLTNENDTIRNAMYDCSWLDKPKWFKKDLMFMMEAAKEPLEIKPYGLYILDFTTYVSIMNAAYTYFNVLRTLRN